MGRPKKVVADAEAVVLEAIDAVTAIIEKAEGTVIVHLDRDPNDPRVKR